MKHPVVLVVLDGFGWSEQKEYNAIAQAHKPTFDYLWAHYPHTLLKASGTAVGLPADTPGNSEVGHITLGAGRIIEQPITLINHEIETGNFFHNKLLLDNLNTLVKNKHTLHLIGLVSDGNVHSSITHIYAYIKAALNAGISRIIIHAILDGRDVLPRSAVHYLTALEQFCLQHPAVHIGSIIGRFFAMDRDNNWDRTAQAYESLVHQQPLQFTHWRDALDYYYEQNISDEFIPPIQLILKSIIEQEDGIIFFNVRPDRARQLISAFVDPSFKHFKTNDLQLSFFITPVILDSWKKVTVLYPEKPITKTLKELLSAQGKSIFSIAETEKYAHITYFFGGGKEQPFAYEQQVLVPSLIMKDYIQHPRMSADSITAKVLESLNTNVADFYLINYANADMVGHSGSLPATIAAIECLDEQLKKLYDAVVTNMQGTLYITADHGNAELKYDEKKGQPHTAHTTNPVPFIVVKRDLKDKIITLPLKGLADVAPFILQRS